MTFDIFVFLKLVLQFFVVFTASPKANQRYSNAVTPSRSSSAEFSKRASEMHRVI